MEELIKNIIVGIGEDPDRIGLKGTPERVARMYKEIFRGYDESQKPKMTIFPNGQDGIFYDEMIIDTGKFYSHCEHHMVPFFGDYWFAYIPAKNGNLIGLSKVARMVDFCAAKLQIQERLGQEILDEIWKSVCLKDEDIIYYPSGMAVVLQGQHLCKTMRGVKKEGVMITSHLKGCFTKKSVKKEFLNLIK